MNQSGSNNSYDIFYVSCVQLHAMCGIMRLMKYDLDCILLCVGFIFFAMTPHPPENISRPTYASLGLHPANDRRRYFETTSLIDWAPI